MAQGHRQPNTQDLEDTEVELVHIIEEYCKSHGLTSSDMVDFHLKQVVDYRMREHAEKLKGAKHE